MDKEKNKEDKRRGQAKYKKTLKGKIVEHRYKISPKNKAYSKEYRKNHKKELEAQSKLNKVIINGEIERGDCAICESPNACAHHIDYSKPYDVIWLCPKHHSELHNRI